MWNCLLLSKTWKIAFIVISFFFLAESCTVFKKSIGSEWDTYTVPPNGVQIADNLYYDQTEVSNNAWLEYLYWLKTVHGSQSKEYREALPDTSIWIDIDSSFIDYAEYYLRHPAYRDHPVVGVTYNQAQAYSKWRSDRVFWVYLDFYEIIANETGTLDFFFTLEKFMDGQYRLNREFEGPLYYPEFKLPTIEEFEIAQTKNDSLLKDLKNTCYFKKKTAKKLENQYLRSEYYVDPIRTSYSVDVKSWKVPFIFFLEFNVAELSSDSNTILGESWIKTPPDSILKQQNPKKYPNAFTGFRNVCTWKKLIKIED